MSPIPVVTFSPIYGTDLLLILRPTTEDKYGGVWAFPGGRIEVGETAIAAVRRECEEETGLPLSGRFFFVDSYFYGDSVGLHFAVEVTDPTVTSDECPEYKWVSGLGDMQHLTRIAGLDNHVAYIEDTLRLPSPWRDMVQADLIADRFLNR